MYRTSPNISHFLKLSPIYLQRNSYRCGIFFAGDELGDPPRFKIFVIPKRFETDCGKSKDVLDQEIKDECNELVKYEKNM